MAQGKDLCYLAVHQEDHKRAQIVCNRSSFAIVATDTSIAPIVVYILGLFIIGSLQDPTRKRMHTEIFIINIKTNRA